MRIVRAFVLLLFGGVLLLVFTHTARLAYSQIQFFFESAKSVAKIELWSVQSESLAHGGGLNFPSSTAQRVFAVLELLVKDESGKEFRCQAVALQAKVPVVDAQTKRVVDEAAQRLFLKPLVVWHKASERSVQCQLERVFPYGNIFWSLFFFLAAVAILVESMSGFRSDKQNSDTAT